MTEDRDLVKRTLKGERSAFDEIVARYQDGLYRHLLRLTGRREEAEDLCQEAFLGFYRSLRRFNPARPIAPFLFTIATNAWKMRRRRPNRETEMPDESFAAGVSVADQALSHLEHQQVLAAVAALQPEQREAVSLFYDQGLSYREISGITGAPVGTVSTRLKRALETLRQALAAGGAGLVVPGVGDLSQHLTSVLQGQANAPAGIGSAVNHGISTLTPAGVGLLAYWKEALLVKKAIYVAIGLAVIGGAVLGVPRLFAQDDAAPSPAQIAVAKGELNALAAAKTEGLSFDTTITRPGKPVFLIKNAVKGDKLRWENINVNRIGIERPDLQLSWQIDPATQTYQTAAPDNSLSGSIDMQFNIDAMAQQAIGAGIPLTKTLLGQETVNGYLCDKYSFTPQSQDSSPNQELIWFAKKIGMIVKMERIQDDKTVQWDFKNIQFGNVPDSLFEVPEGYTEKK